MSVMELFTSLRDLLSEKQSTIGTIEPMIEPPRDGDILHSSASIEKARELLQFNPETNPHRSLTATVESYWVAQD